MSSPLGGSLHSPDKLRVVPTDSQHLSLLVKEGTSQFASELKEFLIIIAGWSSLVARRAHNPKVGGSNPSPATNFFFFCY